MSISTLTTLGAARDSRDPKRQDIGKGAPESQEAEAKPTAADLLITLIPTEFVALYTALVAAIVGSIAKPVAGQPPPDDYRAIRWVAFVVLVGGTMVAVGYVGKQKSKRTGAASRRRIHLAEAIAAGIAAAGWGLGTPDSPLSPYLSQGPRTFVPLLVGFVAVVILYPLTGPLKVKAKT